MDCKTTWPHERRTRLVFKKYDVILTKEKSVLTKTISPFKGRNMETQYNALAYMIDLYLYDFELAIVIDKSRRNKEILNLDKKTKSNKTRTWL